MLFRLYFFLGRQRSEPYISVPSFDMKGSFLENDSVFSLEYTSVADALIAFVVGNTSLDQVAVEYAFKVSEGFAPSLTLACIYRRVLVRARYLHRVSQIYKVNGCSGRSICFLITTLPSLKRVTLKPFFNTEWTTTRVPLPLAFLR